MRKILYGLSAIGLGAVTMATVISCGSKDNSKIIATPSIKKQTDPIKKQASDQLNKADFIMSNAWYAGAAEMSAMAQTEYNAAKTMFATLSKQKGFDTTAVDPTTYAVKNPQVGKAIPVVFMDIDETVLNNVAYQNYNLINHKNYSLDSWTDWVNSAHATKIAGAIEFIKYVWNHGGVVIFDSNRKEGIHEKGTRKNLISSGLDSRMVKDWTFWMQGIDENALKPWATLKNESSSKENRMNALNKKTTGYDLTNLKTDNHVVFKTIMRIGDNLDDFNDNASHNKLNPQRRAIFAKIKDNFGSTTEKGKIYNSKTKAFVNETWNEGYVLMGGNATYGGWESGLAKDYFALKGAKLQAARIKGLHALPVWNGKADWDGTDTK